MKNQEFLEDKMLLKIGKKYKKLDKVLNENLFETLIFLGGIAYLLVLIGNIILASFFGYSIFTNYISELGKSSIVPFTLLNDGNTIFCGIIIFFSHFYYVRKLKIQHRPLKVSKVFVRLGFLSGIIGAVGYSFLGIFSLDRAGPGEWYHGESMGFAFGGFLFSIAFYSLAILIVQNYNLKKVALYGLTFPFLCCVLYFTTGNPFAEWILLFSIIAFFLVFNHYIDK